MSLDGACIDAVTISMRAKLFDIISFSSKAQLL